MTQPDIDFDYPVMSFSLYKKSRQSRITALVLIWVAAWLNSGGVLKHTDDLSGLMPPSVSATHSQAAFGAAGAKPGDDDCAACRWVQVGRVLAEPPLKPSGRTIVHFDQYYPLPQSLPTRTILRAQLRAPPSSFS